MRDGLDPCREGDCLSAMITTDAMLDYARPKGAVVALINGGNFRAALPVGKITQGDIDNLLPFKDKVLLKNTQANSFSMPLNMASRMLTESDRE